MATYWSDSSQNNQPTTEAHFWVYAVEVYCQTQEAQPVVVNSA